MLQLVRAGVRAWLRPTGCRVRPGTGDGSGGKRLEVPGVVSHSRPPFIGLERADGRGSTPGGEARVSS